MAWNWFYAIPLLLGLYVTLRFIYNPLGFLARFVVCVVTGAAFILAFNLVLNFVGLHLAFNLFTILVAGLLQLPGLILLVILNIWYL